MSNIWFIVWSEKAVRAASRERVAVEDRGVCGTPQTPATIELSSTCRRNEQGLDSNWAFAVFGL
jgi:hypothetical protein